MLTGKGMFIWKIKECEGGVISDIVTMCVNAGFSHVVFKIADGTVGYNFTQDDGDMAKALAEALQAVGIEAWGFQFVYGNDPVTEAVTANRRVAETGVDGFVINAETAYKTKYGEAVIYTNALDVGGIPVALSSFRYSELHHALPWQEFLDVCNLVMPQVYWMEAHNPAEQLRECLRQYAEITDLPILPTGAAFCEHDWCPHDEEIREFAIEAEAQDLPGINFWEWAATRAGGFWKTVRDIDYQAELPPTDCDELIAEAVSRARTECEEQIASLNRVHEEELAEIDSAHKLELEEAIIKANNTALENLIKPYLK